MFRAVFFDLDDTLIDAAPAFEAGRQAAFAQALCSIPYVSEAQLQTAWGAAHDMLFQALDAVTMSMAHARDTRFQYTLEQLGVHDDALAARLNAILGQTQLATLRAFADIGILDDLRARGFYLGVITNGAGDAADDSQRSKAAHLSLLDKFDGFWVSDEIGYRKPDPRAFLPALQAVGAPARECLFIGDSIGTDIRGANAAGMRSVLIARDRNVATHAMRAESSHTIDALWQIHNLLEDGVDPASMTGK